MAEQDEGCPSGKSIGSPHPSAYTSSHKLEAASTPRALSVHSRGTPRRRSQIRPLAFVIYSLIVWACAYLVANVLADLFGWRGAAMAMTLALWVAVSVFSLETAQRGESR